MPSKQSRKKKRETEARLLDAQKTILCHFLHEQRKKHGSAYAIIVWNEAGDVFTRVRVDTPEQAKEMAPAIDLVQEKLRQAMTHRPSLFMRMHLERSKIRNEG